MSKRLVTYGIATGLLSLFLAAGLPLASASMDKPSVAAKAASLPDASSITMSHISNYLSKQSAHFPVSDSFIEQYQQASGGYIEYANQLGRTVDKAQHEPDQKWHFFDSWLYRTIDEGGIAWGESAKSRVYSKLLCPELLLWIYEACGADSSLVSQAYDVAVAGKQNGTTTTTIAKNMREVVSWEDLAPNILAGLSEDDPHHVNPAVGDGFKVTGLSYDGYASGSEVSFSVSVTDSTKELSSVSVDGVSLEPVSEGSYSFTMPDAIATISVALKDKGSVDPEPEEPLPPYVIADLDFPVDGQGSVGSYTSSFTCENNGYGFTVSHASNNRNAWSYVAMGSKAADNTATIINSTPIVEKIATIQLNLSLYNASGVDSASLLIADNASFTDASTIDLKALIPATSAPGVVRVDIPEADQIANGYYKIEFDTNYAPGANGFIHLDQVTYRSNEQQDPSSAAVTGISLASSVASGTISPDGGQLTLTPTVSSRGEVDPTVLWSVSPSDVVSLSSNETLNASITVTALKEGSATVTAKSKSNPSVQATYVVTVANATPSSLSWAGRSSINGFVGDSLLDLADTAKWKFTITWSDGSKTTPTFGTGEDDVHVGLYATSNPASEGESLSPSSVFSASDDGKYIVAFYHGVHSSSNAKIAIADWRSVSENVSSAEGVYDFTSSAKSSTTEMTASTFDGFYSSSSLLVCGKSETSKLYQGVDGTGFIKLGTGNFGASLTVTYDERIAIDSVTVRAKQYADTEKTISLMGKAITLTDAYEDYTLSRSNGDFASTNVLTLLTSSSSKRAYIESIRVVASGTQEIGKTSDCLALLSFIQSNLHMEDYISSLGYCADASHHYYSDAKAAFNALTLRQRTLFLENAAYASEFARLSAWAAANGEAISSGNILEASSAPFRIAREERNRILALILPLSGFALSALLVLRRKRR